MKTFKFLVFSAMAVCALNSNAQFANTGKSSKGGSSSSVLVNDCDNYNRVYLGYSSLKPRYSTTFSDATSFVESYNDDLKALGGFKFGYLKGVNLKSNLPLFLEVGAEFSLNTKKKCVGVEYDKDYDDLRSTAVAIDIPISVAYKLGFNNGVYVEPYAGIRGRINVLGSTTYTGSESFDDDKLNWYDSASSQMDDEAYRRFQFGGQFGLNVGYKAVNLNIGYEMYSPLYKSDYSGTDSYDKLNTRNFTIGLGVNF